MGFVVIGQTNKKISSGGLQRNLRSNMTDAERTLWRELRGRQISGLKFRRQHPFEDYILDFVCLEIKLVIEVDGSQHAKKTHPHPGPPLEGEGEHLCDADVVRTKKLEAAGFRVLRFWNNEVLGNTDAVKERIWLTVQEIKISP